MIKKHFHKSQFKLLKLICNYFKNHFCKLSNFRKFLSWRQTFWEKFLSNFNFKFFIYISHLFQQISFRFNNMLNYDKFHEETFFSFFVFSQILQLINILKTNLFSSIRKDSKFIIFCKFKFITLKIDNSLLFIN